MRFVLGIAAVGAAMVWGLAAQDGLRTIRDGVFSQQQAARGQRLFESICTDCHEIEEFTGPDAYLEGVEGEPVWDTFEYVSSEMPEDDPGSLNAEDYSAVLAYLFKMYGLPSGETDLPIDRSSLRAITMVAPGRSGR